MPKDPNALMQLAARVNDLGSPYMKPWHLKANYQTYDADGKPKDQGIFEEWWAAPDKYKISYTSPSFNQVEYHNGDKVGHTGGTGGVPMPESMVEDYLTHPLPTTTQLAQEKFTVKKRRFGNTDLECANPTHSSRPQSGLLPTVCFAMDLPVIRVESANTFLFVLFNDIVRTHGQYIPEQIAVLNSQRPLLNVDLVSLDFPPNTAGWDIDPPAQATTAIVPRVGPGVMAGIKIGGEEVRYPLNARNQRIQGLVILQATITKTGAISDLRVITGPRELRETSLDAVKTWRYTPYLLGGEPVEVETQINVEFTLGR